MCCIDGIKVFFTSELINMSNVHDSFLFSKTENRKNQTILVPYKIGFEIQLKTTTWTMVDSFRFR